MIYIFLAEGFEEVEALAPLDVLRRAGVDVQLVSITQSTAVRGAHGVQMECDAIIADIAEQEADALVLPGGLPGSTNLDECALLGRMLVNQFKAGRMIAAICAAPMVLGHLGLLKGVKATCYPGFETHLEGAQYTAALVQRDGQFITGKGPGAAFEFGYAILEAMGHPETSAQLREGMMYNFLMQQRG